MRQQGIPLKIGWQDSSKWVLLGRRILTYFRQNVPVPLVGLTVLGSILMLTACGGGSAVSVGPSELGTNAQTPKLTIAPESIAFDSIKAGTTSIQTITLSNTGTGPATVSQATISGAGFSLSGLSIPLTLAPAGTVQFSVIFSPATSGNSTGNVSIVSDATGSPIIVTLTGTAVTSQLSTSPASLNFGNVAVNSTGTLPVVVTNTGSGGVTISQASVAGAGFSVSGPALPLILAARQNTSFSVTFGPTAGGSMTGSLSVTSSATNSPNLVSLSGMGTNQHSVSLTWAVSTSPSITGYNVYRGMVSGGPYTKLNSSLVTATTYIDATVEAGETYYYVTTALNSQGVESSNSNQAEAVIPSP